MKIVITGSLGNVSQPLTKELIAKGCDVTVISSSASRVDAIEAIGAKAAIGALQDRGFLTDAFAGADAVYLMVPPNFQATDQVGYYREIVGNYIAAVRSNDVKRVVLLSSYGAHLDKGTGFILGSYHSEQMLQELEVPSLVVLRPGSFFTNLYSFAEMIKHAGFIAANYGGEDEIVLVHPEDIAAAAAAALTSEETGRKVQYVASDERSCNEVAKVLGAAIGKPELTWVLLTDEEMTKALLERGRPAHLVHNFVELGAAIHNGRLRSDYDLHKTVIGKMKLEDFAKEFAARYEEK